MKNIIIGDAEYNLDKSVEVVYTQSITGYRIIIRCRNNIFSLKDVFNKLIESNHVKYKEMFDIEYDTQHTTINYIHEDRFEVDEYIEIYSAK